MKFKMLAILGCIGMLSGCNALDKKCDFLPTHQCDCEQSYSTGMVCARCSVKNCTTNTCSECWGCGKDVNFNDP